MVKPSFFVAINIPLQNNLPSCDDLLQNPLTQGGSRFRSLPLGYMIFAFQAKFIETNSYLLQ
ncbi:hypothetical protein, partial [Marinifilum flexuosum]|uniref:hypothetical protein n=1 Tax=Marinifilum flexuosum TaxID=1117708 RepID=UPI002494940A